MVCILDKRKALVPVLPFKPSKICVRGHQVLKRKGKEKLSLFCISKDKRTFFLFPISHLSLFCILKTLIKY